jgi:hypothetical protein
MNNTDEMLKRILLNMRYDSRKTLRENSNLLSENDKRDTIEYWDNLYKKGKVTKDMYDYHIERIEGLELTKSFTKGMKQKKFQGNEEWNDQPKNSVYNVYDKSTIVTYKSVIPGKFLTAPLLGTPSVKPLSYHSKNQPYYEEGAKRMFGLACQVLSGTNDKYKVGYDNMTDYYMDDNGNRCQPTKSYIEITNTGRDSKYDYQRISDMDNRNKEYFYRQKNTTEWKTPNYKMKESIMSGVTFDSGGINIQGIKQRTKYEYPAGCKPLPFDTCLRWSWRSLYEYGGVDGGLDSFEYFENKGSTKITYKACIKGANSYTPWLSEYAGYYDTSKMTEGSYNESLGVKIGMTCPKDTITSLPSTPSVYYGSENNQSVSDLEKKDELARKYSAEAESYYKEKSAYNRVGERTQLEIDAMSSVVSGGLRIVGK